MAVDRGDRRDAPPELARRARRANSPAPIWAALEGISSCRRDTPRASASSPRAARKLAPRARSRPARPRARRDPRARIPIMARGRRTGCASRSQARRPPAAEPRQHLQGARTPTSASPRPAHGFLEHWAAQGVLLLNAVLTRRRRARAASHKDRGWERIHRCRDPRRSRPSPSPVVFLLWGSLCAEEGGVRRGRRRGRPPSGDPLCASLAALRA